MAQGSVRSLGAYWIGGACGPRVRGGFRSLLAYWMGGAHGYSFVPVPPVPSAPGIDEGGVPLARHHFRPHPIDDDEILEFLKIWTTWQDIE